MEKLLEERHLAYNKEFDRQSKWLGEHETKIDILTKSDATNTQAIKELCGKIGDLVTTIRWLIGIVVTPVITALIGFFIWYVQHK